MHRRREGAEDVQTALAAADVAEDSGVVDDSVSDSVDVCY
jgi:hypothetical protein